MIGWEDVYKVVVVMVPLYVALVLGYGSVRWWRIFNPDQCGAVNRFNYYFVMPFFTFNFTSAVDPYHLNFRFLAGDAMSKAMTAAALVIWSRFCRKGNLPWAITSFSLSALSNTLVVGVPLLNSMYGQEGENLVVQSSVIQFIIWFPILIFLLEFHRTSSSTTGGDEVLDNENGEEKISIEMGEGDAGNDDDDGTREQEIRRDDHNPNPKFGTIMKKVLMRLAKNPNLYACTLGIIWALIGKRWNLEIPEIINGSILIMAKGGGGISMFTMGLFMGLQEKLIACSMRLTFYGMLLRFVIGPLTMALGSLASGLHSQPLRIAIVQAALPQSIASFVYAREYGLHANVLNTAVIFGTIVSLPLLIVYYIVLELLH